MISSTYNNLSDTFKNVVNVCDRTPLVSTISSISILFFKYVIYPFSQAYFGEKVFSQKNDFVVSLLNRTLVRDIMLLVPGLGNMMVFLLDVKKTTIRVEQKTPFENEKNNIAEKNKKESGTKPNKVSEERKPKEKPETATISDFELIERNADFVGLPVLDRSTYQKIVDSEKFEHDRVKHFERTGKVGNKKILLLGKKLGAGGVKSCYLSLQIGGKSPGKSKVKVLYMPLKEGPYKQGGKFHIDMVHTLQNSEKLNKKAAPRNMMAHFIKYKKALSPDGNLTNSMMTAEYIPNQDLSRSLKGLNTEQVYQIIKELLDIGAFLEESKLSHRDFKLENLMLRDGKLVLIDIAGMMEGSGFSVCTATTPAYVAPNVLPILRNPIPVYDPLKEKQDNYAIGILLFELLSRQDIPLEKFGGDYRIGMEFNQVEELIRTLTHVQKDTPKIISLLCDLIQPDVEKRLSLKEAKQRFASLAKEDVNWKILIDPKISFERVK